MKYSIPVIATIFYAFCSSQSIAAPYIYAESNLLFNSFSVTVDSGLTTTLDTTTPTGALPTYTDILDYSGTSIVENSSYLPSSDGITYELDAQNASAGWQWNYDEQSRVTAEATAAELNPQAYAFFYYDFMLSGTGTMTVSIDYTKELTATNDGSVSSLLGLTDVSLGLGVGNALAYGGGPGVLDRNYTEFFITENGSETESVSGTLNVSFFFDTFNQLAPAFITLNSAAYARTDLAIDGGGDPMAVPTPTSLSLMIIGLLLLISMRRKGVWA